MINFTQDVFVVDQTVVIDVLNDDQYLVMDCREESTILCQINVDYYKEIEVLNADFCENNSTWMLQS